MLGAFSSDLFTNGGLGISNFKDKKMSQEAWVLKCYSCKKFQVQLKKKAKKWQCKVCGAKQDLVTIFFKGRPSDCRVNVQNLNLTEGENLEKSQDRIVHKDESYYVEQENSSQNSQNFNCFSFEDENENFSEDAIAEIDRQCSQVEDPTYSQPSINVHERLTENSECFIQDSNITTKFHSPISENQSNENSNEDPFDINSIDFTIKTYKSPKKNARNLVEGLKLSIFESNSDFDESLDF